MRFSFLPITALLLVSCGNPLAEKTPISAGYFAGAGGTGGGGTATGCLGATLSAATPAYLTASNCFVSRASAGTYVNSSGVMMLAMANVQRLSYDPVSLVLNGLLVEGSSMNMLPDSGDFSNGAKWTVQNSPTFNSSVPAPDGSTSVSFSSSVLNSGVFANVPVNIGDTYTLSSYVKSISGTPDVRVLFGSSFIRFDPSNGVIAAQVAVVGTPSCVAAGQGWFRCNFSAVATTNPTAVTLTNRTNVATENAYWGMQLEPGAVATSYIPTSGGTATRSADVYRLP